MTSQAPLTAHALPHPLFRLPVMDPKQRFHNHFLDSVAVLQDQITQLQSVAAIPGERQEAIDHTLAGIAKLQSEVADAADFTPSYDRRQYAETVKTLQDALNSTVAKVTPRSRFQFKRPPKADSHVDMGAPMNDPRLNPGSHSPKSARSAPTPSSATRPDQTGSSSVAKDYNAELAASRERIRRPSFSAAGSITLANHVGLHVVLPASASSATASGSLTHLRRCVIDMSVPTMTSSVEGASAFRGLAMRDIADSVIVAGRVEGAVHITAVSNSVLLVAARQVRIHECRNVDVYLHCGSHPIIEDCSGMRLAPLPSVYVRPVPLLAPQPEPAKLTIQSTDSESAENQWDQVDDFKWLKAGPSPNWTTMSDAVRLGEEAWTSVAKDEAGSVEDVLRKLGVRRRGSMSSNDG